MKKGTKKAHPLPTKVVDEPCYKRRYHGFCYTHFNMNKELALDYLNLTVAHLIDDVEKMDEYNKSFWHEEVLSGQIERLSLTASLLSDLLDGFEGGVKQ